MARRLIDWKEGVKAKCFDNKQIKYIKQTYYHQNMSSQNQNLLNQPVQKDGVSEHSIVCFHVIDTGTCNNKDFFFIFFPQRALVAH